MSLGSLLLSQQKPQAVDFLSDQSMQRYVSPTHRLSNPQYVPNALVPVPNTIALKPRISRMQLRLDACLALIKMSHALYKDTQRPLQIISSYRSHNTQQRLREILNYDNTHVAKVGHSEHQLGLSIDVFGLAYARVGSPDTSSKIYTRLTKNAHKYGRHESYQNGKVIDGYKKEQWHRRYTGVHLATILHKKNQTLSQYNRRQH